MLVAVRKDTVGECPTPMHVEADSDSHALMWMDPFQSDEKPIPPLQQCGYPIIYVDTQKQVGFCNECAADSGYPLDAHLLEGEEPIPCDSCGRDV